MLLQVQLPLLQKISEGGTGPLALLNLPLKNIYQQHRMFACITNTYFTHSDTIKNTPMPLYSEALLSVHSKNVHHVQSFSI